MQETTWVIPVIQTIHILSIAAVISSSLLVDLKIIGLFARDQPGAAVAHRLMPWVWGALLMLALSGSLLVVAEPDRSLTNPAFGVKLLLLIGALCVTAALQRGFRNGPGYWETTTAARLTGRVLAGTSICLWSGVVLAGRLIAYIDPT